MQAVNTSSNLPRDGNGRTKDFISFAASPFLATYLIRKNVIKAGTQTDLFHSLEPNVMACHAS